MIDAIVEMFKNGDGIWVVLVIALGIISAYCGLIKIKNDKIIFGRDAAENERFIMKKQVETAYVLCMAFEKNIPRFEGYDDDHGKYVTEKAYDEIINWIMFNHIADDDDYIEAKQEMIWAIVTTESKNDYTKSDKFKKQCDKCIEKIIKRLVQIRENNK